MKTIVKTTALLVIIIAGTWLFPQKVSAQNGPVSLQVFYDELSPYGTWIDDPNYGYVWSPNVDEDFSPYVTNGHWVFTDYGWTWVSDYPWGWAPFHYGRWAFDPNYGNIWIPGTEWGPAWVIWREANGYTGWTPMGPGVNINIALGGSYYVPRDRWFFVSDRDFIQNDLYRYRCNRSLSFNLFNISLVIRNTRFDNDRHVNYFYGPRREVVQRYAGRVINPVHIRDWDRPGHSYNKDYLSIYRPLLRRDNNNGPVPAPRNISRPREDRGTYNRNRESSAPVRNDNYQGRSTQTVVQQPTRTREDQQPTRNREDQQTSRYGNNNYQGRSAQPVQQPVVNQQRSQPAEANQQRYQREEHVVQNNPSSPGRQQAARPTQAQPQPQQKNQATVNLRQEKAKMVVVPEKEKKEEPRR